MVFPAFIMIVQHICKDGEIISAAQEERFTRVKHDNSFPENSINYILKSNKLSLNDIDYFIFYEKPFLNLIEY